MDSKNHKEVLMMRKDISFIGCSLVIDVKENFLTFVTVMGNKKNKYVPEIVEVYKK
jgi:hypothetical protein